MEEQNLRRKSCCLGKGQYAFPHVLGALLPNGGLYLYMLSYQSLKLFEVTKK